MDRQVQPTPPTLEQMMEIHKQSLKRPGARFEVQFGGAQVYHVMSAFQEHGNCVWALYRCEGGESNLQWSNMSNDPRWVLTQIQAYISTTHNIGRPETFNQASQFGTATGSGFPRINAANFTGTRLPAIGSGAPQQPPERILFEGELQGNEMVNLLRRVSNERLSGRLEVRRDQDLGTIHFSEGVPMHCTYRGAVGDPAITEMVTFKHGSYKFVTQGTVAQLTISKHLNLILLEGAAFEEKLAELSKLGPAEEVRLTKTNPQLSDQELYDILSRKPDIDVNVQMELYAIFDGSLSLAEINGMHQIPATIYVPAILNLISTGVISPVKPQSPTEQMGLWSIVTEVEQHLIDPGSGFYSFPMLLYFTAMEVERSLRYNRPMAFMILDIGLKPISGDELIPLSMTALKEVAQVIEGVTRRPDLVGHWYGNGLGILMTETSGDQARQLANRLVGALITFTPSDLPPTGTLAFAIGVGDIPGESTDLDTLISQAVRTRRKFAW